MSFFPVLDLYRLVISFIAFIHILCCLKIYLHQTIQMGFVFLLKMFEDKCNHDCIRDYTILGQWFLTFSPSRLPESNFLWLTPPLL